MDQNSFFFFQLKDLATFVVGAAGFLTAFVTLRFNVLKKPEISAAFGGTIQVGRMAEGGPKFLEIKANVVFFNSGAQPAIVDQVRIEMGVVARYARIFAIHRRLHSFQWNAFYKNIVTSRDSEPLRIFGQFDKAASFVAVPKFDFVEQIIGFGSFDEVYLHGNVVYSIRLEVATVMPRQRIFRSRRYYFNLSEANIEFIERNTFSVDTIRKATFTIRLARKARHATVGRLSPK